MKIDISKIDTKSFMVHQHIINGEACYLVQPCHIGAKWQKDTLIFRSSLWNSEGELISASFPKFFNWSEQPDISPVPTSLDKTTIVEKIDGSTLIVSKYKGQYILRTRGTSDASAMDNGHEMETFRQTILPKLITEMEAFVPGTPENDTWGFSWLFEWVSPENRIVIRYGDQPDWYLVGMIEHMDYLLVSQAVLDEKAKALGLKRPVAYDFPSVEDLMKDIGGWKGKEGVVVYSNRGQTLHKVKCAEYLVKHRMKEEFSSMEKVIDFFIHEGSPPWKEFHAKVSQVVDYETVAEMQGDISRICEAWKEVQLIIGGFELFISVALKPLATRKEQALKVLSAYGNTNRASFVFKLLDGKTLAQDDTKKLLYQVLKK